MNHFNKVFVITVEESGIYIEKGNIHHWLRLSGDLTLVNDLDSKPDFS